MKTIYFITTNEAKVREARKILKGVRVEQVKKEVFEVKSQSMRQTIIEKAKAAYRMVGKPVVVEDTGFFLKAYPGFPGTYTKFCYQRIGLEGILKLLEGQKRGAYFVTMVAFFDGKKMNVFEGKSKGTVSDRIVKPIRFKLPYDSIFIPAGEKRTYSQMSKKQKAKTSHRAKAFLALRKGLS